MICVKISRPVRVMGNYNSLPLRLMAWFLKVGAKMAHKAADKITRSVMCFQAQRHKKLFGSFATISQILLFYDVDLQ